MKNIFLGLMLFLVSHFSFGQTPTTKEKENLKYALNEDGSHFFQVTFLNQTWVRWNQSNKGTTVQNQQKSETLDIGLRRTRIQMFGQITDNVFIYFQFGQNNFNSQYNVGSNRKFAAFFHDALCEYKVSKGNQLKIGGGLTIANAPSRFSQPSIGTIMTLDVPVFAQTTVDQTDEFSRKLSVYARGQVGKFDYRLILSDPFPILSNGVVTKSAPTINSNFAQERHEKQFQGYLMYQFFEHEQHLTPYMTGTHLGKKKVFNIAGGIVTQKDAMWHKSSNTATDTVFQKMQHWCIETFLDMPLNANTGSAISAYAGFYHTNYGKNYLRFNGLMNPANGTNATDYIRDAGATWGNALPMFGTGKVFYTQIGYLLPTKILGTHGRLMPCAAWTHADYERLNNLGMDVIDVGVNWLIKGHNAKLSINYQNRPTYHTDLQGSIKNDGRKNGVIVQYQITI